ncbi:unnamed protein product [Coffea canephora]|uniref:DH200=94 genomic scaffold, scaffold_2782 n=1 Tax=Coffea canephora TaxID=49390 RepID=A0A068VKV9_COFCA|nr:unnamed protein product [Coffea canephora]
MSLADPHLLEALKVQVQIIGAKQVSDAIAATLHYQMVYRVQNHAQDLAIPGGENALLIRVDEKNGTSCTHVPRQILKQELIQLLPNDWITDYEDQDIIQYFDKEGLPVSWFQDPISGHVYFDVCNVCEKCQLENTLDFELPDLSRRKKSRPQQIEPRPCKLYLDPQDPDTDTFVSQRSRFNGYQILSDWVSKSSKDPLPPSKKDFHPYYQKCLDILEKEAKQLKQEWKKSFCNPEPLIPVHIPQVQECFKFSEADFPKLETFNKNGSRHTPKIQNISSTILPSGETVQPNPSEDVLNWQTENSLVQNIALTSIHRNVSEVKGKIEQIDLKIWI